MVFRWQSTVSALGLEMMCATHYIWVKYPAVKTFNKLVCMKGKDIR